MNGNTALQVSRHAIPAPGTVIAGDVVIGIDPGVSGAIAILPRVRPPEPKVYDMPVIGIGKGFVKRAVDLPALTAILRPYGIVGDAVAYVERVSAFPGQGVASMFSLGMSYWGAAGVLAGLQIRTVFVEPKQWKSRFALNRDKMKSLEVARRYFPGIELGRKKDHNRAEALLIAQYGGEQ